MRASRGPGGLESQQYQISVSLFNYTRMQSIVTSDYYNNNNNNNNNSNNNNPYPYTNINICV